MSAIFGQIANGNVRADAKNKVQLITGKCKELRKWRVMQAMMIVCGIQLAITLVLNILFEHPKYAIEFKWTESKKIFENKSSKSGLADVGTIMFEIFQWIIHILFDRVIWNGIFSLGVLLITCYAAVQALIFSWHIEVNHSYPASKLETLKYLTGWFSGPMVFIFGMLIGFFNIQISWLHTLMLNWETGDFLECFQEKDSDINDESARFCYPAWNPAIMISFYGSSAVYFYYYFGRKFELIFPTIEKTQTESIRMALFDSLIETVLLIFKFSSVPVAYIVYRVYTNNHQPQDYTNPFFSANLWIQVAILPTIAVYVSIITVKILQIVLTQKIKLPVGVEQPSTSSTIVLLCDAMLYGDPLVKALGFYEFNLLTRSFGYPVLDFYKLSHPGGHPRNWSGVFESTVAVCRDLTSKLNHYIYRDDPPANADIPSSHIIDSTGQQPTSPTSKEERPALRHRHLVQMRDLTTPSPAAMETAPTKKQTRELGRLFIAGPHILWLGFKHCVKHQLEKLRPKAKNFEARLGKKNPDIELLNAITATRWLIHWGLSGLAQIICSSIEHDIHGVVQRDIQIVAKTYVDLHEALCSATRYPVVTNPDPSDLSQQLVTVLDHLIFCVSNCASRIHSTHAQYYDVLGVPIKYQKGMAEMYKVHYGR